MDRWVPHDTLFANLLPPRLKLGLDEAQHLPLRLEKLLHRRQNDMQGDKRDVDDRKVQRLSQILRRDIADIRPLHADDPGVLPDFPGQLPIAHIDGEDLLRPVLEQAVGKAAGGRAGVAAGVARRVNAETPAAPLQASAHRG